MNYYPTNFYSSYPYQNNYQQPQQMVPTTTQTIPGKLVENFDIVKVTDVPFGGYGVFPKADLSEIYIKMWNGNGTTSIATFKPAIEATVVKEYSEEEKELNKENFSLILERLCQLEEKLDNITTTKRKELSASAY